MLYAVNDCWIIKIQAIFFSPVELTVFDKTKERESDKRKRKKNNDAADIDGFLGPWGGYVDEKRIMQPTEVCIYNHL